MKPTPIFVAAAGFAMLGACSVETEDNPATGPNSNGAVTTTDGNASVTAGSAGADTLGNQLNQLNESDSAALNEAQGAETNAAE